MTRQQSSVYFKFCILKEWLHAVSNIIRKNILYSIEHFNTAVIFTLAVKEHSIDSSVV
jgi:hypothetical protein